MARRLRDRGRPDRRSQRARAQPDPRQADRRGDAADPGDDGRHHAQRPHRADPVLGQGLERLPRNLGSDARCHRLARGPFVAALVPEPAAGGFAPRRTAYAAAGVLPRRDLGHAATRAVQPHRADQPADPGLPDGRRDVRRRLHALDLPARRPCLSRHDDGWLRRRAAIVRRRAVSGDLGVPAAVRVLHGAQHRLARQFVPRQSQVPARTRAADRDHLAAIEGFPGERQRLAVADRRRGTPGRRARALRRCRAAAASAAKGLAFRRRARHALPRGQGRGLQHRRPDGTCRAAARDEPQGRCRRRGAAVVAHREAGLRPRRPVPRLSRLRPRRDRALARGKGRGREPRQVRLPRRDEPRDPDAHERRARACQHAARNQARSGAARGRHHDPRVRRQSAAHPQRHPRSVQARGRPLRIRGDRLRTAGAGRDGRDRRARERQEQGAHGQGRARSQPAADAARRRRAHPAGAAQPPRPTR